MSLRWFALALALSSTSCLASSAVAPEERVVHEQVEAIDWQPVAPGALRGLYSSERVSGPLAGVLHSIHYLFRGDGSYTGAALIGGEAPEFQVLTGTWRLEGTILRLDDAPPAELFAADDRLRLVGPEGTIVFRRAARD